MWIIVSAAADPLYVIPVWIFDCVLGFQHQMPLYHWEIIPERNHFFNVLTKPISIFLLFLR